MVNWTRGLVLLALLTSISRFAAAQRVLLAQPSAADSTLFEAFGRLRAELELQAFEVVVLEERAAPTSADELERAAQARAVFAAIALQRDDGGTTAEVLIVDRVTGKSTTRKLLIDQSLNGPTLLAVRAADLLRASLVEFAPGERPPKEVVGVESAPPPPEVVQFARKTPRVEVRAGGVTLLTPTLGYGIGPFLGLSFRPVERLALGLEFCGPLHGAKFESINGVASVRQEFALVHASWNLSGATSGRRWEWGPVLGAGAYHLSATSVVSPPLVSRIDDFWSLIGSAGVGARYFFDRSVNLGAHAGALALLPRPAIAVDDQRSSPIALQARVDISFGVAF